MHELWHVALLGSALFGAAGAALLFLGPLLFDGTPPGLERARPAVIALLLAAGALVVLEWTLVH